MIGCTILILTGCRSIQPEESSFEGNSIEPYQNFLTAIEYPEVDEAAFQSAQEALSNRPLTVSEYEQLKFQELSLEEAIRLAMTNSKVISKIGGQVISAPNAAMSVYDPAVQESSPLGGVEGALSAFDARWDTAFNFNRSESKF